MAEAVWFPPPKRLPPVLAPRGAEDGGGPAGVVESPPKSLFGAGVVDCAADVPGALAGVPKLNVGVEEAFASALGAPKENPPPPPPPPPPALGAPKRFPPDALVFGAPPNKFEPDPDPPALLPNRFTAGFSDAPVDPKRLPDPVPVEAGVCPKLNDAIALIVSERYMAVGRYVQ